MRRQINILLIGRFKLMQSFLLAAHAQRLPPSTPVQQVTANDKTYHCVVAVNRQSIAPQTNLMLQRLAQQGCAACIIFAENAAQRIDIQNIVPAALAQNIISFTLPQDEDIDDYRMSRETAEQLINPAEQMVIPQRLQATFAEEAEGRDNLLREAARESHEMQEWHRRFIQRDLIARENMLDRAIAGHNALFREEQHELIEMQRMHRAFAAQQAQRAREEAAARERVTNLRRAFRATSFSRSLRRNFRSDDMQQAITNAFTPNQAFLLSIATREITPQLARTYLIGPTFTTQPHSRVRIPDYQSAAIAYNQHIYNRIDARYRASLAPLYWKDSSRRCFEGVLAYYTLCETVDRSPEIATALDRILGVFRQGRNGALIAQVEHGQLVRTAHTHRTDLDLNNAILAMREKFGAGTPRFRLLKTCILIWASVNSGFFADTVHAHYITPFLEKGRDYHDSRIRASIPHSDKIGQFKHDDFMPEYLKPIFGLDTPLIRGANFSKPVFAARNNNAAIQDPIRRAQMRAQQQPLWFDQTTHGNTLLHQGGISGFSVGLLGMFYEYPETIAFCHGNEAEIWKVLLSAMVYALGGHSYLETITSINLPAVRDTVEDRANGLLPFCDAIRGNNIFDTFTDDPLIRALHAAKEYEAERREAL